MSWYDPQDLIKLQRDRLWRHGVYIFKLESESRKLIKENIKLKNNFIRQGGFIKSAMALQNEIFILKEKIAEMREIILELGKTEHKNKKLADWYSKNKGEL